MANYTNCITLEQMEWLDLFDEIPYKVVKKLVKLHDETDFEVEIKDLPIDGCCMCSTSFTFKLEINISQGSLPLMVDKEYCVIKEYNGSSPMAMFIGENLVYPESEEEEEEVRCVKCWSCDEAEATHKVFRDALGEYEHTCDKCFKKEYEEEEE